MRMEFRLAGSGGQGVILAGVILAEAAVSYEGLNAVQSQSYGPESRGGASKCEVIISDGEIYFPKVISPDVMLIMNQSSWNKYIHDLKKGGIVVADSTLVKELTPVDGHVFPFEITGSAIHEFGRPVVANIIGLGCLAGVTGVISKEAVRKAIMKRVPKGTEELNERALELGYQMGIRKTLEFTGRGESNGGEDFEPIRDRSKASV
ncbi:MAG TPA: 2-oxoacid:ferredoxin oxidoreductase subunit gamma [Firmicutes bacterium]|nr:2-oxoacid:ferredoxin oxidoreductase subunit gamma [Bacillota bacterium]